MKKMFLVGIMVLAVNNNISAEERADKSLSTRMTIKEAIEIATNEVPGHVIEVVPRANHYEIRILTFDRKKVVVKVDPIDRVIENKKVFSHASSKTR